MCASRCVCDPSAPPLPWQWRGLFVEEEYLPPSAEDLSRVVVHHVSEDGTCYDKDGNIIKPERPKPKSVTEWQRAAFERRRAITLGLAASGVPLTPDQEEVWGAGYLRAVIPLAGGLLNEVGGEEEKKEQTQAVLDEEDQLEFDRKWMEARLEADRLAQVRSREAARRMKTFDTLRTVHGA